MKTKRYLVHSITLVRIACALIILIAARNQQWGIALVSMLVAFVSDFFDGWLARRWQVVSNLGAFLVPFADKVVCLVVFWLVALHSAQPYYILLASLMTSYDMATTALRLLVASKQAMPASHLAKLKTAVLMTGLVMAVVGIIGEGTWWESLAANSGMGLLSLATVLSVYSLILYIRVLVKPRTTGYLEYYQHVTDIDLAALHKEYAITTALFDIDGTIAPWREQTVSPEIIAAITTAKLAGIKHIGLVTNMHRRNQARLEAIAKQLDIQVYILPLRRQERKPSPRMIFAALKQLGSEPGHTVFIGDKVVDVIAGRKARLARVIWVSRLGNSDHLLDKLVYRPIEPLLKWLIH